MSRILMNLKKLARQNHTLCVEGAGFNTQDR